jgi:predicted enzyme related to lactoylglutathione lyase
MHVLSSRVLLYPTDFDRAVRFYGDTLGLEVYREYGAGGAVTGVVYFLGGGYLEVTSVAPDVPPGSIRLWIQVPDVDAEHDRLASLGVEITDPPADMPWGLREMSFLDPDGTRLRLVQVPETHPLRRRVD